MLLPSYSGHLLEAGCDEAGRGCLAGPVFAAAVILPGGFSNDLLNDSKKISERQRDKLRVVIEEQALAWAVEMIDNDKIDEINILNASILAMHKALNKLTARPQLILVDGNRFHAYNDIKHICIVKGDGKYQSIAAASVLAKTWRDEYMKGISIEYPEYGWNANKGYPTAFHRNAIREFGISPYHRKSFRMGDQLRISF